MQQSHAVNLYVFTVCIIDLIVRSGSTELFLKVKAVSVTEIVRYAMRVAFYVISLTTATEFKSLNLEVDIFMNNCHQ